MLRVGSRVGRILPARLTSGGKVLLAALPPDQVTALYEGTADVDLPRLRRELALVRRRGFAINDHHTPRPDSPHWPSPCALSPCQARASTGTGSTSG